MVSDGLIVFSFSVISIVSNWLLRFMQQCFEESKEGLILKIKVIPKARKSEIVGIEEEELKIRISAPPEKGEANAELLNFLSKTFDIPKRDIFLLSGQTSRHKKVLLCNTPLVLFQQKLNRLY